MIQTFSWRPWISCNLLHFAALKKAHDKVKITCIHWKCVYHDMGFTHKKSLSLSNTLYRVPPTPRVQCTHGNNILSDGHCILQPPLYTTSSLPEAPNSTNKLQSTSRMQQPLFEAQLWQVADFDRFHCILYAQKWNACIGWGKTHVQVRDNTSIMASKISSNAQLCEVTDYTWQLYTYVHTLTIG